MCDSCPRFNIKPVCVPTAAKSRPRLVPEDLSMAGVPSQSVRCCQDPRLMQICKPQYFEPSYCREPDNMTRLVAHTYKQRWIDDHQQWAQMCAKQKCGGSADTANTAASACGARRIRRCVSGRSESTAACRQRPEDLPMAGKPSHESRCCQDPRLMLTCDPRYFEPSYCREADNMSKLVAHEYKYRWMNDRRDWALKCCRDVQQPHYCDQTHDVGDDCEES